MSRTEESPPNLSEITQPSPQAERGANDANLSHTGVDQPAQRESIAQSVENKEALVEGNNAHPVTEGVALEERSTSVSAVSSPTRDQYDENEEPESLTDVISRLPKRWMRHYALKLYETHSPTIARESIRPECGGISFSTLQKALREVPELAELQRDAMNLRHNKVDEAVYRGATEGDETPIVAQGAVIDTYRKRSDKAAEVYFKRHGLMADQQVNVTHNGKVELADDAAMVRALADASAKLFGAQVIEAEVVSESDRKDG